MCLIHGYQKEEEVLLSEIVFNLFYALLKSCTKHGHKFRLGWFQRMHYMTIVQQGLTSTVAQCSGKKLERAPAACDGAPAQGNS